MLKNGQKWLKYSRTVNLFKSIKTVRFQREFCTVFVHWSATWVSIIRSREVSTVQRSPCYAMYSKLWRMIQDCIMEVYVIWGVRFQRFHYIFIITERCVITTVVYSSSGQCYSSSLTHPSRAVWRIMLLRCTGY